MKSQKIIKNLPLVFILLNTSSQILAKNCINITANNVHLKGCAIASSNPTNSELTTNAITLFKELSNGRSAYWHEASGTVIIRNPKAKDGGTAFQPKDGRKYFDEKLK